MEHPTITVRLVEAEAPFVRPLRQSLAAFTHSHIELPVSERLGDALGHLNGSRVDAVLVDLTRRVDRCGQPPGQRRPVLPDVQPGT